MNQKASQPLPLNVSSNASGALRLILQDYDLPEAYSQLVTGPWRVVAQAVLDQYGEDSDAWNRMTWFSRILCTAIQTSFQRGSTDAVADALNGFKIWLHSYEEENDSIHLVISAADYVCSRLLTQIGEDIANLEQTTETRTDTDTGGEDTTPPETAAAEAPTENTAAAVAKVLHVEEVEATEVETVAQQDSLDEYTTPAIDTDKQQSQQDYLDIPVFQSTGATKTRGDNSMDILSQAAPAEPTLQEAELEVPSLGQVPASKPAAEKTSSGQVQVPMGTWLGFHDQDMPTLAKLAVYDRGNDSYIFANKQGLLVRQLTKLELQRLIESELVELIESRSVIR
jgi:Protein of unknown function (DUF1631)